MITPRRMPHWDTKIDDLAAQGKTMVAGSMLFGQPVDPENKEHLYALIAVLQKQADGRQETIRRMSSLHR